MSRPPSSRGGSIQLGTLRPGTGQRQALGSSLGRPGTNRLRTGQVPATPGQSAGIGISLNTEVQVAERPVTQQGMMGMRVGTSGGVGRQVQDTSFFMGKLHQKISELQSEIEKFSKEIDQDSKDKSQFSQLERKYETSIKEVRQLEGQLADYNLAMDKLRSSADINEINEYKDKLHERNSSEAIEIDNIFLQRQEQERITKEIDSKIHKLYRDQEQKMNQLSSLKLNQYKAFVEENKRLEMELNPKQQEYEMIGYRIKQIENEFANDQYRNEYIKLENIIKKLKKEKETLEADYQTAQMNPEEARALMLAKVKDDNVLIAEMEKQLKEVEEETSNLHKTLSDLKIDIDERKGENGGGDSQKLELLMQRDEEMSNFIESFQEKKEKEIQQQKELQETIVALLEHISQGIEREGQIPNKEKFKDLQGDLNFKEKQLQTAQSTKQRLEQELQKRSSELEKINTLDEKISVELGSLNEKIDTMIADMKEFGNVDMLKAMAENSKQLLIKMKQKYIRRRDAIKQQANGLNFTYDKLKSELTENDTARGLEDLEVKLKRHEETIFHLREFVHKKQFETDYQATKQECSQLVLNVNNAIIKMQSVARGSISIY